MRAACLMALAALTVSAQDRQPGGGPNLYSLEKESALGASLAADLLRQATPLDSTAVSDFVTVIGSGLSARIPAAPFPYTFTVITGDLSNVTHEPVAVPGGRIFVPVELILAANDEAELAGMLAHSMVHISERHYTRQATRTQLADIATIPLVFMGGWSGYGAKQTSGGLIPVGMVQFQRTMETEADAQAIQITSAAGFDPSALVRYISRVQAAQPGTTGTVFAVLPPAEQRASLMETAIRALPPRTYTAPDPEALGRIQAEIRRVAPVAAKPQARPSLRRQN
jgi:predicted Zn-dependent protease